MLATFSILVLAHSTAALAQQCETPYMQRCEKMKTAAEQFSPTLSSDLSGAKGVTAAQRQAFTDTADAWASSRNTCVEARKACQSSCTTPDNLCARLNDNIYQAQNQMLTYQNQAAQTLAGEATQDDAESSTARELAAQDKYGEKGARVEQATTLCWNDNDCVDTRTKEVMKYNQGPNGRGITILTPDGVGSRSIINSEYTTGGVRR